MHSDDAYLLDMLIAARLLRDFSQGHSWESFEADALLQSGVRYQEQILGEAANQVSLEFRREHREIPWDRLIGLRHRLVHGYREIENARVWRIIERDLAKLIGTLELLVPPETDSA